MKCGSFLPGLVILASVAYLASGASFYREDAEELQDMAQNLPEELSDLYDLIVDPYVDEVNRENYIWRCFELLRYKKYRRYTWFKNWLVDISRSGNQQLGRRPFRQQGGRTPKDGQEGRDPMDFGGRTPQDGQGGRYPNDFGGRYPIDFGGITPNGGPGGRTPQNMGGRTPQDGEGDRESFNAYPLGGGQGGRTYPGGRAPNRGGFRRRVQGRNKV